MTDTAADGTTRHVLFETGIGVFFDPKLKDRFGVVEDNHALIDNLAKVGIAHDEIDAVVLSHLHFDHAGGLLTEWRADGSYDLLFPNARYVVGATAWQRAKAPHFRDRASFVPALHELLEASGRLVLVDGPHCDLLPEGIRFHYSDGHTPGLMLAEIAMPGGPVLFAGDLIPGAPWVHLPITMGYDRYPELLIDEKRALLGDLIERQGRLFFTHDANVAMSGIGRDDRQRFHAKEPVSQLSELTQ